MAFLACSSLADVYYLGTEDEWNQIEINNDVTLCYATIHYQSSSDRTYTVAYDANGGTGAPSNQTKRHGIDLVLSTKEPTRDGYVFVGWNTDKGEEDGTVFEEDGIYEPGEDYCVNADLTLYAMWYKIPQMEYGPEVTIKDLVTLMKYIVGAESAESVAFPDPDGSGHSGIADVIRLARYLAGYDVEIYH